MGKKKVILSFGFLFLFILIFLPGYSRFQKLSRKNRALENQLNKVQAENKQLEEEIRKLENDPTYIEQVARHKLKVSKKDEIVYEIIETDED